MYSRQVSKCRCVAYIIRVSGLDCIGLVIFALELTSCPLRLRVAVVNLRYVPSCSDKGLISKP